MLFKLIHFKVFYLRIVTSFFLSFTRRKKINCARISFRTAVLLNATAHIPITLHESPRRHRFAFRDNYIPPA